MEEKKLLKFLSILFKISLQVGLWIVFISLSYKACMKYIEKPISTNIYTTEGEN